MSYAKSDIGSALRSPANRGTLITFLALLAGMAFLYAPVMVGLVRQWSTDDNYSHGFIVIPLAAYFAWEKREALLAAPIRPSPVGLLALVVSLLAFAAGQFGAELFLTRASLIGVLASLVLFHLGWRHLRLLALPMAFLLLMVPLPTILFNYIAFPLQTLAAQIGETAISAAGVPVLREGNILMVPGRSLEVAEACSGIRSLMSLLTLAIALGYFTDPTSGGRTLLALSAIPIAVLVNAARVAGTGIATYWVGPAAADGFFHTFSGWLMFIAATGLLMAAQHLCATTRVRLLRVREATA